MNTIMKLMPELILSIGGTSVLLISAIRDDRPMREFLKWLSFFIVLAAGFSLHTLRHVSNPGAAEGWLVNGNLNIAFGMVFLANPASTRYMIPPRNASFLSYVNAIST